MNVQLLRFASMFVRHNFFNCCNGIVCHNVISGDSSKLTYLNYTFLKSKSLGTKMLLSILPPKQKRPPSSKICRQGYEK